MEQPKLNVDVAQLPWAECECGNKLFVPGMMFKRMSQLISPTGKEELIPVEVLVCTKCNKVPSVAQKNISRAGELPVEVKAVKPTKLI